MPATEHTTRHVDSSAFAVDIRIDTAINAPADTVWRILTDTDDYPDWNPFITSFTGPIALGGRLDVTLNLPGRRPTTFRPTVVELDPGHRFAWLGHLGIKGLFDGRHSFTIEPIDDDHCRLVHAERLTGALIPLARGMLTGATADAFAAMNAACKERAERG